LARSTPAPAGAEYRETSGLFELDAVGKARRFQIEAGFFSAPRRSGRGRKIGDALLSLAAGERRVAHLVPTAGDQKSCEALEAEGARVHPARIASAIIAASEM